MVSGMALRRGSARCSLAATSAVQSNVGAIRKWALRAPVGDRFRVVFSSSHVVDYGVVRRDDLNLRDWLLRIDSALRATVGAAVVSAKRQSRRCVATQAEAQTRLRYPLALFVKADQIPDTTQTSR